MWFRNLQLYRFSKPFTLSAEALEERLAKFAFIPCRKLDPFSQGWVSPIGREGKQLVHTQGTHVMLALQKEQKIVPASVVRDLLEDRVADLEAGEQRTVGRREREQQRERLLMELLPLALSRRIRTFALLAPDSGWLMVDSASRKGSDELTALLREAIGTLPVVAPSMEHSVAGILTNWVMHGAPKGLVIEDECELRDKADEGGTIRCRHQDLGTTEIRAHLDNGMEISKLALSWQENVSFVVDDKLAIKRLRFLDLIQEQADDVDIETEAERFDVDMAIMAPTLTAMLAEVEDWFGGLDSATAKSAG
jgi:recombination associated protein RdgC